MLPAFATYLYPQTCITTKPLDRIKFIGHSLPHFNQVREQLAKHLSDYPQLPLRKADGKEYLQVHSQTYLRKLLLKAKSQPLDAACLALPHNGSECEGLEFSLPGYLYGLGGMLEAIDLMQQGVLERAYCFSLVGHHAHREWGHGYCLLNPQAAAARYAQTRGFKHILIVDWDIHHGDGTQSIFSGDANIYCISIHSAVDLYMAKASDLKAGTTTTAEAVGHCNIPLLTEDFNRVEGDKIQLVGFVQDPREGSRFFTYRFESYDERGRRGTRILFGGDLIADVKNVTDVSLSDCSIVSTGFTPPSRDIPFIPSLPEIPFPIPPIPDPFVPNLPGFRESLPAFDL